MLYRALANLQKGEHIIEAGDVFAGSILNDDALAALERKGRISPVNTPPLAALPAWRDTARTIAVYSERPFTVQDFIEQDDAILAGWLKKSPAAVRNLKRDLLETLKSPRPKGR